MALSQASYLAHVDETLCDSYDKELISRVFALVVGGQRSEILGQL